MFSWIFRALWRIIIFGLGASVIWMAVFRLYPYVDSRVPTFVAVLCVYCALAYGAIPALIRLWRLVIKPDHIPLYATTGDGWAADPVNIAVVARSKRQFVRAMRRAGWYQADPATLRNLIREGYAIVFNKPYPRAPFSTLYLLGRPFDIGFQKPANSKKSPRSRHHVRFWQLAIPDDELQHSHLYFWVKKFKHLFGLERQIWIGAAIDDTGPIGLRWRNGQITHKNDPDTNKERDLIISDLQAALRVRAISVIHGGEPFRFRGQTLGNTFICDGTVKVVELTSPAVAAITASLEAKESRR